MQGEKDREDESRPYPVSDSLCDKEEMRGLQLQKQRCG